MEDSPVTNLDNESRNQTITTFSEITPVSKQEAIFFLESHNYDLDSAITTFFEATDPAAAPPAGIPRRSSLSPSSSHSRSRSASPPPSQQLIGGNPYSLRFRNTDKKPSGSRSTGRIHTFSDLNRPGDDSGSDSDEPQRVL